MTANEVMESERTLIPMLACGADRTLMLTLEADTSGLNIVDMHGRICNTCGVSYHTQACPCALASLPRWLS